MMGKEDKEILPPYQSNDEEEVTSFRQAVAGRCAAAVGSLLGEHLPPDDQLTHPLLRGQRQQAVVLAVQAHVQQVLFGQMVGYQVGLEGGHADDVGKWSVNKELRALQPAEQIEK